VIFMRQGKGKNFYSNLFILLALSFFIINIIKKPTLTINSAKRGLAAWFNILIPSLLPFLFFSEILILLGFVDILGELLEPVIRPFFNISGQGAFPFLMSIISGYPVGAKLTSSLRKKNMISLVEANRLIAFASTSGPLFILGAVAIGMLNNPNLASLMLMPHYLAALSLGFIFSFYQSNESTRFHRKKKKDYGFSHLFQAFKYSQDRPLGVIISKSIQDSTTSIILIGGYVIIYSVIIDLILSSSMTISILSTLSNYFNLSYDLLEALVAGLIEISTACFKVSSLDISLFYKILLLNFFIAWGGFSIQNQALGFIGETDINKNVFLFSRLIHGGLTLLYTYIIYLFKYVNTGIPISVSPIKIDGDASWLALFYNSTKLAFLGVFYILLLGLASYLLFSRNKKRAN